MSELIGVNAELIAQDWITNCPPHTSDGLYDGKKISPMGDVLRRAGIPLEELHNITTDDSIILAAKALGIPQLQVLLWRDRYPYYLDSMENYGSRRANFKAAFAPLTNPEELLGLECSYIIELGYVIDRYNYEDWRKFGNRIKDQFDEGIKRVWRFKTKEGSTFDGFMLMYGFNAGLYAAKSSMKALGLYRDSSEWSKYTMPMIEIGVGYAVNELQLRHKYKEAGVTPYFVNPASHDLFS